MSSNLAAARTYAKALLGAAGSKHAAVADELDEFVQSTVDEPAVWQQLIAPEVSTDARRAAIDAITAKAQPTNRNLLRLLNDNGRLAELPYVAAAYRELVEAELGNLDVNVTSAVELPAALRSKLEERLSASTGKQVRLHTLIDPEIIGGLVVQHGDTLVDTSLRSRLDQLKLQLSRPSHALKATTEDNN